MLSRMNPSLGSSAYTRCMFLCRKGQPARSSKCRGRLSVCRSLDMCHSSYYPLKCPRLEHTLGNFCTFRTFHRPLRTGAQVPQELGHPLSNSRPPPGFQRESHWLLPFDSLCSHRIAHHNHNKPRTDLMACSKNMETLRRDTLLLPMKPASRAYQSTLCNQTKVYNVRNLDRKLKLK